MGGFRVLGQDSPPCPGRHYRRRRPDRGGRARRIRAALGFPYRGACVVRRSSSASAQVSHRPQSPSRAWGASSVPSGDEVRGAVRRSDGRSGAGALDRPPRCARALRRPKPQSPAPADTLTTPRAAHPTRECARPHHNQETTTVARSKIPTPKAFPKAPKVPDTYKAPKPTTKLPETKLPVRSPRAGGKRGR